MYVFSYKTFPVFSLTTFGMSILSESQDQYQPNIPGLDASSMHCASIVLDVVQRSQYVQDLHDLCLLDQWARRILFVFCLNPDLQVSIHC